MKLLLVTDAWSPQVNGVVNTYKNVIDSLRELAVDVEVIHPYLESFKRNKLRIYPEIEYVTNLSEITKVFKNKFNSETYVHIATEGPIGIMIRNYCVRKKIPFTTGFHTLFPEFLSKRFFIPTWITYPYFRWFHSKSSSILAPTLEIKKHLLSKKFNSVSVWSRGVDLSLFNESKRTKTASKYILCVSRVSKEKGLDDFCKLDHPNKVLIGDGPYLDSLKFKYPNVTFLGKKTGEELARWYANAECFVFPSKTDTFGIVLLEAIASGTPVAAYPQPGPKEVILEGKNGSIDENLQTALQKALQCDRYMTYLTSEKWTWKECAFQFIENLKQCHQK